MNYRSTLTVAPGYSLSGLPETSFATFIGTAPDYASSLDEAIKFVYVRANYNRNIEANGGKLPLKSTTFYSEKIVAAIIKKYRELCATGVVRHLTTETISTPFATDVYSQVTSALLVPYSSLKIETVRAVLREFFYAVVDQKIDPEILLPAIERYPTPGAQAMYAQREEQRKNQEEKDAADKQTFFGSLGAAVLNIFRAPGDLASAATTTATVAGIGLAVVGVTGIGLLVYGVYKKINQLDVNQTFAEQQKTIRKIGPDTVAAVVRGGIAA